MKESVLRTKSYQFALDSVFLYKQLQEKNESIMSKQFMRSATSVGANVREGGNAQSGRDFVHKLSISLKECGESQYWLDLLKDSNYIAETQHVKMFNQAEEIHKMLSSSILTVKNRMKK